MMTARDLAAFIREAAHGEQRVYHTGNVAAERRDWKDSHGVEHAAVPGLDQLAKQVQRAVDDGLVTALQRCRGPGAWDYIVTRTIAPTAPPVRLAAYGRRNIALPIPEPRAAEPIGAHQAGKIVQRALPSEARP